MKGFFVRSFQNLKVKDRLPRWTQAFFRAVRHYFRLEVEGARNLPIRGKAIIVPNHSGWSGFDAVLLRDSIKRFTSRMPRILVHPTFFILRTMRKVCKKVGFRRATFHTGIRLLQNDCMVVIFPEAEFGNFKPTAERYRLREFKLGFVRMALLTGAPIIPTIIIGAEETHINLAAIPTGRKLHVLPVPLNVFPLPAKWKIKFLDPIYLTGFQPDDANDDRLVESIAHDIRARMQAAIDGELRRRKWIYFAPPARIEKRPAREEQRRLAA